MDHDRRERDVVLITVDSLQYDYVYGDSDVTRELDTLQSLADSGTCFTNAFSNASITVASFLSILSGTYPWMFESISGGYGPDRPHVAEELSDAGYATAGFNTNPYLSSSYGHDRGFDYYMGRDNADEIDRDTLSTKLWPLIKQSVPSDRVAQGIRSLYGRVGATLGIQLGGDPYLAVEEVNDSVIQWVERTPGPRFLWIHYMDVHTPYYPHEGTVSEGMSKRRAVRLFHRVNEQGEDASSEDLETLRELYKGEVQYFDRKLGELLKNLNDHLDLEETLIALTSDHGEAFGEHGNVFHPDGALRDELTHVPLVVDGPGFDTDTDVETPVSNVDLVPTLLSAAGVSIPDVCIGEDLSEIVDSRPDDRTVFAEAYGRDDGKVMATDGRHKLIRDIRTGEEVLFDRENVPAESEDVIGDRPRVRRHLNEAIDDHLEMVRGHEGRERSIDVDEETKSRLRMLGYKE